MTNRNLAVLGVAAVIMVACAVYQARLTSREKKPAGTISTYLIQGLEPAKIAEIVIGTGEDAITLKRQGSSFFVANKDYYPANTSRINDLLTGVLDIKTRELITSNPENYVELEVTEEKADNAVRFLDKESKLITGAIIGKRDSSGDSYVRRFSSDDVYIAEGVPWIRSLALDFIDQQLIQLESDSIIKVVVTEPNGNSYALESEPNSTDVTLGGGLPAGKKLKSDAKQVFSALTNLRFTDVMKESGVPDKLNFNHTYLCTLKDSTLYTLKIAEDGKKAYIKCDAAFTDTEGIAKKRKVESEEELRKKEEKLLARDAADRFSKKHSGWVYEIGEWKAKNLTMGLDKLLEDEEKPKPTDDANSL